MKPVKNQSHQLRGSGWQPLRPIRAPYIARIKPRNYAVKLFVLHNKSLSIEPSRKDRRQPPAGHPKPP